MRPLVADGGYARRLCLLSVVVLWTALGLPARALSPLESTRKTLEQTRVIVDSAQSHNDKLAALAALLKNFLDTDSMGQAALDKHWAQFSSAQQKEFLMLFGVLFQRTYVQKLLLFERPDFAYVGQEQNDGKARVDTKIITPRDEFAVTYQMRQAGDNWMATDIKIEGTGETKIEGHPIRLN